MNYQTVTSNQIFLNASQASTYNNSTYKSDMIFSLKDVIDTDKNTLEVKLSIVHAQFPYSFYQVNSTNNTLYMIISSTTLKYTLVEGNYTISSFITMFQSVCGSNWTITYSDTTHLLTFTNTNNIFFTFFDSENSCFPLLGFVKGMTYDSFAYSITTPFMFNLYPINRLHIGTCSFGLHNVDSYIKSKTRTLVSCPINCQPYGVILFHNPTFKSSLHEVSQLTSLHIQIYDDNYNLINFHNQNWSMTIQLDVVRENFIPKQDLKDIYDHELALNEEMYL